MKRKVLLGTILFSTIWITACKNDTGQEETNTYTLKGDTVYIHDNGILESRIILSQVTSDSFSKEVITAGTVQAIPTHFAYIAPPFSGRVTKTHVKLGQKVYKDTPLFEMSSPDFMSIQKEFFQAISERDLAKKDLARKEDLLKNGVGSQKELEEAVNALEIAQKEYENAYSALKVYQVNPEDIVLGQPLVIRSPIEGDIIEDNIITGQYMSEDAEYIAVVADLSKVWITAQVKEKDIRFIHMDDEMDIHIPALPGTVIKGKVFHVDEMVDEETRSIRVLSICENKDEKLKLGMYATVHFIDEPADCLVIPEKALLQDEKYSYVFVKAGEHVFVKRPVEVEVTKDGKAIITEGLQIGDTIISEGGYYLK